MAKSQRGFAGMDEQQQRKIASMGGRAAHERGTAHEFNASEAREAGRKGGEVVSRNREHMAAIGRMGGLASRGSGSARKTTKAAPAVTATQENAPATTNEERQNNPGERPMVREHDSAMVANQHQDETQRQRVDIEQVSHQPREPMNGTRQQPKERRAHDTEQVKLSDLPNWKDSDDDRSEEQPEDEAAYAGAAENSATSGHGGENRH